VWLKKLPLSFRGTGINFLIPHRLATEEVLSIERSYLDQAFQSFIKSPE
jgi:hypothetical protein